MPPLPQREQARRLTDLGRHAEAAAAWRVWLAQAPQDADGWFELGWLLRRVGDPQAALAAYSEAIARGVRAPEEAHLNRAVILSDDLHRDADAQRELELALTSAPSFAPARLNLGKIHEDQGRHAEARACYGAIVDAATGTADEHAATALARLVELDGAGAGGDALFGRATHMAAAPSRLSEVARAQLGYALGRAHEARGDHDAAFAAFDAANRWAARGAPRYAPAVVEAQIDALVAAAHSLGGVERGHDGGNMPGPVFICGMFRSGSTLVERVLAAHPAVVAGGELAWFPRLVAGPLAPYPVSLARVDDAMAERLAAAYRIHIAQLIPADRPAPRWFTDKRPDNFLLLTLIKRLFPRARIIHTVRNPLDNGLSIWQQHLDPRVAPHATDLAAIGHWYGQYRRLMRHQAACWPDDVLDFDYDGFVADPEPWLRRLLAFLDLPWEPACLDFHRRGGAVRTASYLQVRKPLYRDASGRWRAYGERLAPLRDALLAAGVTLPDER